MSEAFEIIAAEIADKRAISFARFMELALYCPDCGYYEAEKDTVGRRGDYYTSVSVGSLFGELLGFQFAAWFEQISPSPARSGPTSPARCQILEAGAHQGHLARDILCWLGNHRAALFRNLEYWIIEPSRRRRQWQQDTLAQFSNNVRWAAASSDLPPPGASDGPRIIFANELLDAMPVHRFAWDARTGSWFEWGIMLNGNQLAWTRLPLPDRTLPGAVGELAADLSNVLPDGFVVECSPAAENWWRSAATLLGRGKLLALDYGLTTHELLAPERKEGTLRAYRAHQFERDLLAVPGKQDITAHVDFSVIRAAGEAAGLTTECFATQENFLTGIAGRVWENPAAFGHWTSGRTRQFQTLTHPNHLGRCFRVLVQHRPN